MKKVFTFILAMAFVLVFSMGVFGTCPIGFGARAAGMGGAYTAVADDGAAPYWNPAGITQLGIITFTPGTGFYGSLDPNEINSILNPTGFPPSLPIGNAGMPVYAGLTNKYFAVNFFADLSISTAEDSEFKRAYGDGNAYGTVTGAATFGKLSVGANFKYVKGETAEVKMVRFDPDNPADANKLLNPDNNTYMTADGDGYSLDVGLLYKVNDKLKLGFMGRNLLSSVNWNGTITKYTLSGGYPDNITWNSTTAPYTAATTLPHTYAVGMAYRPYKSALIAVDVETITSDNAVLNQTRYHVGLEQTALWKTVALRAGAYKDKNETAIGLTAGLGFKLGPVVLDVAATQAGNSSLGVFAAAGFKF